MDNLIVKNNLILTSNQITVVFKIDPIDLIILPEQEQKTFEMDMKRMLNIIGENSIQIIMRTRKATKLDLGKHFSSFNQNQIFNQSKTETITKNLISQYVKHLEDLLENNIIPVKEYYLVLKQNLTQNTPEQMIISIKKLERYATKICSNFKRAGIELSQVKDENKQLTDLIKSFTRF